MPAINILVTQRLTEKQIHSICEIDENVNVINCKADDATQHAENADILITWGSFQPDALLSKARRLKWIHTLSSGVDGLLTPKLINSDIILTNSRGLHGIPVAEHVLALIFNFTRGISLLHDNQKNKLWQSPHVEEVYEKSIAIIGLGSVGREIAKRAKSLGMKVMATKRTITTELFVDKLYTNDQLPQVLSLADFVVVTLPLTEETKGLFDKTTFSYMKKDAYFINVARGSIVNEEDLAAALQEHIIKGAALDVFANEPLPADSPLWEIPNLFISPHIAAKSPFFIDRSLKLFHENLNKFLSNTQMLNMVDKQKGY